MKTKLLLLLLMLFSIISCMEDHPNYSSIKLKKETLDSAKVIVCETCSTIIPVYSKRVGYKFLSNGERFMKILSPMSNKVVEIPIEDSPVVAIEEKIVLITTPKQLSNAEILESIGSGWILDKKFDFQYRGYKYQVNVHKLYSLDSKNNRYHTHR